MFKENIMPKTILVVDDEVDMLFLLKTIIEDNTDYIVETTNSPVEAVALMEKQEIDLVVTDLKMPVMDGMDLFEAFNKFKPDVPVIIITAYGSQATANEALKKGVADFITKPFRKDSILFTIKRVLELVQIRKENMELKMKLEKKEN